MTRRATVLAPAKVNLTLHVLGRRPDGYHEVDTLFQAVDLCDEIRVELGGQGVRLDMEGPDLGPARENLAYRAAARFVAEAHADVGVHVRLIKRIPVGAGLGGGSSDAAAVLRALAALHDGLDASSLGAIAAELGSDVPFFLGDGPLARGTGRGEVLEALSALPAADLVLVSPPVHISTAWAYATLAEARARGGASASLHDAPRLTSWSDLERIAVNDFEPVISASHPEVDRALEALRAAGASVARMTGSGSTCFGLMDGPEGAEAAAAVLGERTGWPCVATRTLEVLPGVQTRQT